MYKFIRYFTFGLFVICNVIIATSAIWNLSLINGWDAGRDLSLARHSDGYSIFVGCAGLLLIFPILFCEISTKDIFLTKLWFELVWVGLFCTLGLVGAALATAVGADHLCQAMISGIGNRPGCISSRLLQGSSWTCSLLLLVYFVLLTIFTLLKVNEDPTVWYCYARKFPWGDGLFELPNSPSGAVTRKTSKLSKLSLRRFRSSKTPTIVAPLPRRAANDAVVREAILSYRSGLSLEYEIEHFQHARPIPRPELAILIDERPGQAVMMSQPMQSMHGTSLYPEHMRRALAGTPRTPPLASNPEADYVPNSLDQLPPSPNPVGDWPQLNPPVRRLGEKRRTGQTIRSPSSPSQATTSVPSQRTRPTGPRRPSIDATTRLNSQASPFSRTEGYL
ncbi:hypothetical protein CC1G_04319 [Coprinopsis cinerea okayama7|uniref:Uncharacterized protein n=1 Tax=Coprinopsis cinerea (strain Okayama-7 / 130 / ATCC MYA-4618 / FGSC 9003) TaxID=240176 RepID=A8NFP7_COPC7|nr:hypothetical protein CC1G_04319 [Coprinopsis cinerea okayama7\|eukprot:XP_001833340.1 hypothetical protein CC1G_04319 [Coprinopsis cinerea okayama7\